MKQTFTITMRRWEFIRSNRECLLSIFALFVFDTANWSRFKVFLLRLSLVARLGFILHTCRRRLAATINNYLIQQLGHYDRLRLAPRGCLP
jgi:hypothetical protein